ncbi:hypothetical protein CNYM01_14334 [Colletotrichum nymphaeae SA-01]|uniref:Uncharacterized protein n=1 Tax=Colletotrichum nymphaeae SA-01 TaxID=1460502 RepID=A0A135RVC7_9PEZI|nr:hypothetical protein CNYM01_14334 [Colletotrichum nymphaeae SA-01]
MVSFTFITAALLTATAVTAQLPAPGQSVDCDCTTLRNGEVVPDDDGVRKGCAGRGYLVTRNGDLKCVIVEDGTPHHNRARDFVNNCSLHGTCGWVGHCNSGQVFASKVFGQVTRSLELTGEVVKPMLIVWLQVHGLANAYQDTADDVRILAVIQ